MGSDDDKELQPPTIREEDRENIEPVIAPTAEPQNPASRSANLEEEIRQEPASSSLPEQEEVVISPRTIEFVSRSIETIGDRIENVSDYIKNVVIPKLSQARGDMSPIALRIAGRTINISHEAKEYLLHNPEIITGLFYSVMFYHNDNNLQYLISSEIGRNAKVSAAFNAFQSLITGGSMGFLTTRLMDIFLQILQLPSIRNNGIAILQKFMSMSQRGAEQRYIQGLQAAENSLSTDDPFYIHTIIAPPRQEGSLLLGPSVSIPSIEQQGSLLLGPSAQIPSPQQQQDSLLLGPAQPSQPISIPVQRSLVRPVQQPDRVFNVTGMNAAPPIPMPTNPQSLARPKTPYVNQLRRDREAAIASSSGSPGAKSTPQSLVRPKGPYVQQLRREREAASGSGLPLVKQSKNQLALPYFDNFNDSYVFKK
jgi:hypothetical protein